MKIQYSFYLSRIVTVFTFITLLYGPDAESSPLQDTMSGIPSTVAKIKPAVQIKARPFELKQVRLLDGPFKDAMELNRRYLHQLDPDRLLHTFRINAGLETNAEPLGGWESPNGELRGHSIGHFLSGCALAYAQADDLKLKARGEYIVSELARCQKALGESGYLSAWPEEFIDRVEARQRVWAPYYTLHKIMAGLVDMYMYCENKQALETAERMAYWIESRMSKFTDAQIQAILNSTEQGGMNDVLCKLYILTGDNRYLETARRFDQKSYNNPLAEHKDNLAGQHANSFIPNIIGSAREYELTGDSRQYEIASYFWSRVVDHRMYATGGTSDHEHFPEHDKLAAAVSGNSHESCCTYNMLKLTEHLFSWNPSSRYGDYYERALYNAILPTVDPETGMTMYYVAMRSGLFKTFGTQTNAFWCCTGTGMENHVKYGSAIYYHGQDGLYINLFIPSRLDWPEKGLVLRQETRFPEEQTSVTILRLKQNIRMNIRIRIPYWTKGNLSVKINGMPVESSSISDGFMTLDRLWEDGDRIEIDLPMRLHHHRMPDDENMVALMYGPLVLAGKLGSDGLADNMVYGHYGPGGNPTDTPVFVGFNPMKPDSHFEPVPGNPLTFRSGGIGKPRDATLVPFYKLFGERYAIYWSLYSREKWLEHQEQLKKKAELEKQRQSMIIDEVVIGSQDSETAHKLHGNGYQHGPYLDRHWIHALYPGWFGYELKLDEAQTCILSVTYWGADSGGRIFDIIVDDRKIATQELASLSPGQFIDVEYKLPDNLVRDKQKMTVIFKPHENNTAGGVFGVATMKK